MAIMIRSDNDIQTDVIDTYVWDPAVDAPDVGVQIHEGVVTLAGKVDTYTTMLAAKKAAQRVEGVRVVLTQLERAVSAAERAPDRLPQDLAVLGEGRELRPLLGLRQLAAAVAVTVRSVPDDPPSFAHRVLDRLTAMKLRVAWLRLRLRRDALSPEEIEIHLAQIEHEIDAMAALAHDVQAKEARSQ